MGRMDEMKSPLCFQCGEETTVIERKDYGDYEEIVCACYNIKKHPRTGYIITIDKQPSKKPRVWVKQFNLDKIDDQNL